MESWSGIHVLHLIHTASAFVYVTSQTNAAKDGTLMFWYMVNQVERSKWNVNKIIQDGIFNVTDDLELECLPTSEETTIEKYFQCPALAPVLQLYSTGQFIQYMVDLI